MQKWKKKTGRPLKAYGKFYTIYRKEDDEIVATGTSAECIKQLGCKEATFYSLVSRARHNKGGLYEVFCEKISKSERE